MLYASKYYTAKEAERHVLVVRSSAAFDSLESMSRDHVHLLSSLPESKTRGLLIDLRDASGRNDPAFEEAIAEWRRGLAARYPRVAVLLRSSIGAMQVNRLTAVDGTPHVRAFTDKSAAIAYAEG